MSLMKQERTTAKILIYERIVIIYLAHQQRH